MLKRQRDPYPSDLTDAEWKVLEPLIPGPAKLGRPPRYEKRAILNAIFSVGRGGCSWRRLPTEMAALAHRVFLFHALAAGWALDRDA